MSADLSQIQRWMQTVITHPDGIAAGIDSPAARQSIDITAADVEQVISRSQALDSVQRLHVYGSAYYTRLIECLAVEFPAVHAAVGEDAFGGFVFGYLQQYPSTSYTLGDLGAGFPQYLAESRPPRTDDGPDWADFLVDLATLERTYSEVFDGPGEEREQLLTADDLLAVPADRWGDVRLRTARSLRFLELRFPVHEFATAVRRGKTATMPAATTTRLAISRRDYIVRRRPLAPLPDRLLQQLQQGETLGAAIEAAVAADEADMSSLADHLREWFRLWTQEGYFLGLERETE